MKLTGLNILIFVEKDEERKEMAFFIHNAGANVFVASNSTDLKTIFELWDVDLWLIDEKFHFEQTENIFLGTSEIPRIVLTKSKILHFKRPHISFIQIPFSPDALVKIIHKQFWQIEDFLMISENEEKLYLKMNLIVDHKIYDVSDGHFGKNEFTVKMNRLFAPDSFGFLDFLIPHNQKVISEKFMVSIHDLNVDVLVIKIAPKDAYRWSKVYEMIKNEQEKIDDFLLKVSGK
jgi:hypothetical protein